MSLPLDPVLDEFTALEAQLADPDVLADQARYRALMRRYGALRPAAEAARALQRVRREREDAAGLLDDPSSARPRRRSWSGSMRRPWSSRARCNAPCCRAIRSTTTT
jgi:protein subunit release factor A